VILLENHSQSEALAQMPELSRLASVYGQATNYFAVDHPSLPNYLAIWGGSTFGVTSNCSVGSSGCVPTGPSVFGQTVAAGETAKAYQESMTTNCQTSGSGLYAPRHGPWPYWTDTTERAACLVDDVPSGTTTSGALASDAASGNLPVTGEVTPNLCNDAHDCSLATADAWLGSWIPTLMAGPDYTSGRLTIVITFDEDDSSQQNQVALVAIDPRLSGKTVTGTFNHYSLTRWLDANANVSLLRNAATAPDLRAAFGL
jgi:acid phosphatase